jgi:DNA-directed RNA polymerase subunit RPC12/RpoP
VATRSEDQSSLPGEILAKRSDPVYNAHAYLTKVPVAAIEPFLEAFTDPGDLVLDTFGGSGMTGVAAAMLGRRAEIRDISVLGRHIGRNYLNLVDADAVRIAAAAVVERATELAGDLYATSCAECGQEATLSRTVWTYVYECGDCGAAVDYYDSFRAADWNKAEMECTGCGSAFATRGARRLEERPVLDTIACECSKRLCDQPHVPPLHVPVGGEPRWPGVAIGEERQMFQASALAKHGLLNTSAFFSRRNLVVLGALRAAIEDGELGEEVKQKLLFAFTAILTRASKRYQWHPKRPLNAANQNYYVAPVFYEWNVYDLFTRKVEAAIRSDAFVREGMASHAAVEPPRVRYELGSADAVDLEDGSVDLVFVDPPFGSNIFYSDMNLFQEAWLDAFTDHEEEAVVDRTKGKGGRDLEHYERLIGGAFTEAHRVLRTDGRLAVVFSNSNGSMWALLQRSLMRAGFELEGVTLLNKGQRSVKGLASGFENVVTVDLVISLRKAEQGEDGQLGKAPAGFLEESISELLEGGEALTPSHLYLEAIRRYLHAGWDVSDLHIRDVALLVEESRYLVDPPTGKLVKARKKAAWGPPAGPC